MDQSLCQGTVKTIIQKCSRHHPGIAIFGPLLALALASASTASISVPQTIENARTDVTQTQNTVGGLIFSATYSGNLSGKHYIVFRSSDNASPSEFAVVSNPEGEAPDWKTHGQNTPQPYAGRLATIPLPAGNYEFRGHIVVESGGRAFDLRNHWKYPFSVTPGKWTYLGNIHAAMKREQYRLGIRTFITNEPLRDLPLFHSRYSTVDAQNVIIDQRDVGEIDQRFSPTIDDLNSLIPSPDTHIRHESKTLKQLDDLRDLLPK